MNALTAIAVAAGASCLLAGALVAQDRPQGGPSTAAGQSPLPDLPQGLQSTPGCMGIEMARTRSGKSVIFAWFEDKEACLRWYYSEMHQQAMDQFFPDRDFSKPMENVPDDVGPIMAVASITPADQPTLQQTSLPVSQISIELYTPITGGLFLGERFAPASLKVEGMEDYTPE